MKLLKHQQKYKNVIKWILDCCNGMCSGRSTLMMFCFVEIAKENPNEWILVFDHSPGIDYRGRMFNQIKEYTNSECKNCVFEFCRSEFKFRFLFEVGQIKK